MGTLRIIEQTDNRRLYEGTGYRMEVKFWKDVLTGISIYPYGDKPAICPDISANISTGRLTAKFSSCIPLEESDRDFWIRGMDLAFAFIREAEPVVKSFIR